MQEGVCPLAVVVVVEQEYSSGFLNWVVGEGGDE